jgi:hypothetical protein
MMDDVLLNQWGNLAGATAFDCTTTRRIRARGFDAIMEPGWAGTHIFRGKTGPCSVGGCSGPLAAGVDNVNGRDC